MRLPHAGWAAEHYRVESAPIVTRLAEGDRIELGQRTLTVLHLPGHSPGSIGFFDELRGTLFSGDALYDGELLDALERSNVEHYRKTLYGCVRYPFARATAAMARASTTSARGS